MMSTSSSLCTVTPSLVNTDMVPSLDVFPTLISDDVKSLNVSASFAFADSFWKGNRVTCVALLLPPLATPTFFVDAQGWGDLLCVGLPR